MDFSNLHAKLLKECFEDKVSSPLIKLREIAMVTTKHNIKNLQAINHFISMTTFIPEGNRKHIYHSVSNLDALDFEDEVGPKSATKRSVRYSSNNKHVNISKFKKVLMDKARSRKESQRFLPEGYLPSMPVGIDGETRDFLNNLMDRFVQAFSSGTALRLDLGIISSIKQTLEALSRVGTKVANFFRYVFSVILVRICPNQIFWELTFELLFGSAESFRSYFSTSIIEPEGGLLHNLGDFLSSSLCMVVFKKTLGEFLSEKDYLGALHTFMKISDSKKKLFSLVETFFKFVTYILEFLAVKCNFRMPAMFDTGVPEVDRIYAQFLEIRSKVRDGFQPTYDFAEKVFFLQVELEGLLGRYADDRNVKEKISYLISAFRPLIDLCERNAIQHNGPRVEALGALIGGPSGVGKSTNTMPLLLAFMSRVIPDDLREEFMRNHNDLIFFRCNENDFWDGMREKVFSIVYDDFGQKRDSISSVSNDAFEIIRLINTAPYHLHFSSIEEKQRHYARVKTVFATTNRRKIKFESIVNSEAVIRRFKIAYVQVPKAKYCIESTLTDLFDRRLDMQKVRADYPLLVGEPSTYVITDIFEFHEWDFNHGVPVGGEPISFDDLVDKMVSVFRENTMKGDQLVDYHKFIKEKYSKKPSSDYTPEGGFEGIRRRIVSAIPDSAFTSYSTLNVDSSDKIDTSEADALISEPTDSEGVKTPEELHVLDRVGKVFWNVCRNLNDIFLELGGVCFDILPDVAAFAVGLCIGWKIFESSLNVMLGIYRWLFPEYFPESNANKGARQVVKTARAPYAQRRVIGPTQGVLAEGLAGQYSWLYSALKKSIYELRIGDAKLGFVTFIKGTLFMCPAHFEYMVQQYIDDYGVQNCRLYKPGNDLVYVDFDWFDQEIYNGNEHDDGLDVMFMRIRPQLMRPHQDISRFFVEPSAFVRGNRYSCAMPVLRNENITLLLPEVHIGDAHTYNYSVGGDNFDLKSKDLVYNAPTEKGDCGSLIICGDGRFGKPVIFGIHTAGSMGGYFGSRKIALGVSISNEFVTRILGYFEMADSVSFIDTAAVDAEFEMEGFTRLAQMEQPYVPNKTSIERSCFYGKLWDIKQVPAKMRSFKDKEGNIIDPQSLALRKYLHSEPRSLPQIIYDGAYAHLSSKVMKNFASRPWVPRLFSFDEALSGIPGIDYVDPISRRTSPGYPHCLDNKAGGKKKWLGLDGEFDLSSEGVLELKSLVDSKLAMIKNGERPLFVYVDYLKDELRPVEKVKLGKTRQFMAGPVELLILYKMYFGDFVRHCLANRIFCGSAVGIDPYSEWTTLARYLRSGSSWVTTAGDFSGFDTKIPVAVGNVILDIISAFYGDQGTEDQIVRQILFLEVINSRHIAQGIVYEHNGGNPSGNFLTALYNSLAGYIILSMSIVIGRAESFIQNEILHCDSPPSIFDYNGNMPWYADDRVSHVLMKGWDVLDAHCRIITFGDDNIVRYDKDELPSASQSRLGGTIKKYFNMDYTPEDKSDFVLDDRSLSEVSFLKRTFRLEKGIWYAPLDLDVLKETLNWRKKTNTHEEFCLRIEGVLREFSLHGKTVFEEHAPKLISLSVDYLQYVPLASSYEKALGSQYGLAILN